MNPDIPIRQLLQYDNISAYFTTRGKCDQEDPYSGFNVCHYTGDTPEHVASCRQSISDFFKIPMSRIIIPRQTHSTNVATITDIPENAILEDVDAIITNLDNIIIGVNTADCVPIVLIDSVTKIAGIVHAGWRGAVNGITEKAIQSMVDLGASPSDIKAAIGPSICLDCFEVGQEVARLFDDDCVEYHTWTKPHVSLHKYTFKSLINCGIINNNITNSHNFMCSKCNYRQLWSARKLGTNSGRIFTFVVIK